MLRRLEKLVRTFGWLAVAVIIVLSVLPAEDRPHTGAGGHFEHILAYLIAAILLAFGYRGPRPAVIVVVGLSSLSGLMEILQIFIRGRHSGLDDAAASSFGAFVGVLLVYSVPWSFRQLMRMKY